MSKHPLAQTQIHLISLSLLICLVFNYSPQEIRVGGPPSLLDTQTHSPKIFIIVLFVNTSIFIEIMHIQRKIIGHFILSHNTCKVENQLCQRNRLIFLRLSGNLLVPLKQITPWSSPEVSWMLCMFVYRSAGPSRWSNSSSIALWEMREHDTPLQTYPQGTTAQTCCAFTIFVQCMWEPVNHYSSVEWPNPSGSRKCSHFSCVTNRKSVDKCVHLLCHPMRVTCVKFCSTEDKDAVESTNIISANIDCQYSCFP